VNGRKQKRSNQAYEPTTDPLAQLNKKTRGAEATLGYLGHIPTENRNGLVVDVRLTQATGTAERETALEMIAQRQAASRATFAGDRGTIRVASWINCGRLASHRMSRRTIQAGAAQLMDERLGMTAMR
jgi:hypothetical protein